MQAPFVTNDLVTSEQALWEINKLYPIPPYGILVINTRPRLRLARSRVITRIYHTRSGVAITNTYIYSYT